MNPIVRNFLAVIAGIAAGSIVNMALVNIGPSVIPIPEGTDISSMEALKESMKSFGPANFIFPYLGHMLGTLVGGFVVAKLAVSNKMTMALVVGGWFLLGGIYAVYLLGGPTWFKALDILSYIPAAWIGGTLATKNNTTTV